MKHCLPLLLAIMATMSINAKTLIVYYSYTNNTHQVMTELHAQLPDADILRIQPAEKGLNYAANNYAIGSAQIAAIRNNPNDAAFYPAIDPTAVDWSEYNTVIIGAPLWWSQMAAPMQTFLFQNGSEMAGKNIGLVVSSASSSISGVESDAQRLVPEGNFFSESLWVRSSQTSNSPSLISAWLEAVDYTNVTAVKPTEVSPDSEVTIFDLNGAQVLTCLNREVSNVALADGIYIVQSKDGTTYKLTICKK